MNDWMKIFWITLRILGKSGWEIYDKFGSFLFSFSPFPLSLHSIQRSFCKVILLLKEFILFVSQLSWRIQTSSFWVLPVYESYDFLIQVTHKSSLSSLLNVLSLFFIANGFLNIPFSTHFYLVGFNSVHEVLLTWLWCTPSICMQNQGFYLHDVNQLPVTNTVH